MSGLYSGKFWCLVFGGMLLSTGAVLLVAKCLAHRRTRAVERREIWRHAMLGLLALAFLHLTGLHTSIHWTGNGKPEAGPLPDPGSSRITMWHPAPVTLALATYEKPASFRWPATVWLAGAGLFLLRLVIGIVRTQKIARRGRPIDDWQDWCAGWRDGRVPLINKKLRVIESDEIQSPMALGLLHPAIVLPAGFRQQYPAGECEAIFLHEMAHIAARDTFWRLAMEATRIIWWWNPVVWIAARYFNAATESAADTASLLLENGPRLLAGALVRLGRRLANSPAAFSGGVSAMKPRSELGRRVSEILSLESTFLPGARRASRLIAASAVVISAGAGLAASCWMANASETDGFGSYSILAAALPASGGDDRSLSTTPDAFPREKGRDILVNPRGQPRGQVTIETKFMEIPEEVLKSPRIFKLLSRSEASERIHTSKLPVEQMALTNQLLHLEKYEDYGRRVTLPDLKGRDLLRLCEESKETDVITLPSVTTEEGRWASIGAETIRILVAEREINTYPPQFRTPSLEFGPRITVLADYDPLKQSLNVMAYASSTDFAGYDQPSAEEKRANLDVLVPHPRVRLVRTGGVARLREDETLVLISEPFVKSKASAKDLIKNRVLVLLTITRVDPAGNRIMP